MSRSDLRPLVEEIRTSAEALASQLRHDMQSAPPNASAAQRQKAEHANMSKIATAFVSFKKQIIAAGATSHGLHPVYHAKLEVCLQSCHRTHAVRCKKYHGSLVYAVIKSSSSVWLVPDCSEAWRHYLIHT